MRRGMSCLCNILIKIFSGIFMIFQGKHFILLSIITLSISTSGNESLIQLEAKGAYVSVSPNRPIDSTANHGLCFFTDFYMLKPFSENLSLIFDQRLREYGTKPLFTERQLPVENHIYTGIKCDGAYGVFQVGANNEIYPRSIPLSMPNLPVNTRAVPEMMNGISGSWNLERERLNISSAATCIVNSFTLIPDDSYLDPQLADAPPYGNAFDADLWAVINVGFSPFSPVIIEANTLLKNDLSSSNSCNLVYYSLGIGGKHNDIRKRFFLNWNIAENFAGNESFASRNSSKGFFTEFSTRVMYKIKPQLLLKGVADLEISEKMLKIHYETGIRKQWKEGSILGFTYSGTSGVLFPRQIAAFQSKLRILPHFGIAPDIRFVFGKVATESKQRYYRSDYALELLVPLVNRMEAFSGYMYRHYKDHPLFSSNNTVTLGLRTW